MNTHYPTSSNGNTPPPPTEVLARPQRRRFSAAYKQRILDEADRCTRPGEIGALLRREGLYSSNLTTWPRQRAQETVPDKPGRTIADSANQTQHVRALERENARLKQQLKKAELIIEVQKNHRVALAPPVCVETLSAVSCVVSEDSGRRVFGGIAPVKNMAHGLLADLRLATPLCDPV